MTEEAAPTSRSFPLDPAQRLERLESFARALSLAVTAEDVGDAIAGAACATMSARAAIVFVPSEDGRELRVIGERGMPPDVRGRVKSVPIDAALPICVTMRTGQAQWIVGAEEYENAYRGVAHTVVPRTYTQSIASLPIVVEGRVVAGIGLGFDVEGTPLDSDRAFLHTLLDLAGQALERARRVQAEKAARVAAERLAIVLDSSEAMTGATDEKTVLERVTHLCVPRLGDWCAIDLVGEGGGLELAAVVHVDPSKVAYARTLRERYPIDMSAPRGGPAVLRTGEPELYPEITDDLLEKGARDEEELRILREVGMRSVMIVPLRGHGQVIGTMSLISTRDDVRYDATDLRLAEKLASRAALALDNARLMDELRLRAETEREARETAQRAAAHLHVLAEVSGALTEARLDPVAVASALARVVATQLGDSCVVLRVGDDGVFHPAAIEHADAKRRAEMMQLLAGVVQRVDEGVSGRVVATGKSVLLREIDDASLAGHTIAGYTVFLKSFGVRSMMVVPITIEKVTVGTIVAMRDRGGPYEQDDVALLQDLAERTAAALSNAQLHTAERRARHLVERQQAITTKLGAALTTDAMSDLILEETARELGADGGAYYDLVDGGRVCRLRHERGTTGTAAKSVREFPASAPGALGAAIREKRPLFVDSIAEYRERFPDAPGGHAIGAVSSFACLPLVLGDGTVHGVVTLASRREHGFAEVDRAFAANIAEQCAQALERARLLAAERAAKAEAVAASRLKDEFLATVSHELRTPLNAILGWASLLRTERLDEPGTVKALETIERNARAQARLVEDVLDVSRIISGKLAIKSDLVDVVGVLLQALDVVRPSALAKDIAMDVDLARDLPRVRGDADRLQQVYWNILSNAVKFTPRGGRVLVHAAAEGDAVVVSVTDTGQGIRRDFLPHLFEAFRQADGTSTRAHGGLGLGLSIARSLVDLHGGEISAASEGDGRGSTFVVRLPAVASERAAAAIGTGRHARVTQRLEGIDVLCVDDDPDARDLAVTILEAEGARVRTAASANEAATAIASRPPDLLLCDIGMPEEDGLTFLPRARALPAASGRRFPAIAFTAYADAEHVALISRAGFDAHLSKPVDAEALVQAVARALAR